MRRAFIFILIAAGLISLTGCNLPRIVRDPEIREFNESLKDDYKEIWRIHVHIGRPNIFWNVYLKDASRGDEIFQSIVEYIKTSNIYENKLRDEYTGIYYTDRIKIKLITLMSARNYEGYYYQRGTTIYVEDTANLYNVVDNFTTWYISEDFNDMGTYKYQAA